jgi:hypothetical protein
LKKKNLTVLDEKIDSLEREIFGSFEREKLVVLNEKNL